MSHRIFVAIPVPDFVHREAIHIQKRFPDLPVRWVKPEHLHVTVVPPWYAEDHQLYVATQALKRTAEHLHSFSFDLSEITYGPQGQPPRLIWAIGASGEAPRAFGGLREQVEDAFLAEDTGFTHPEHRRAHIHLTLARFRQERSVKAMPKIHEPVSWRIDAEEIRLLESTLQRSGTEYAVLQSFSLGGE